MVSTDVRWLRDVVLFLKRHTRTENREPKLKLEWDVFMEIILTFYLSPFCLQCFRTLCCKGPPTPRPEYDVVCIGLTGSGKTSLLSRLCSETADNIVPTTGQPTITEPDVTEKHKHRFLHFLLTKHFIYFLLLLSRKGSTKLGFCNTNGVFMTLSQLEKNRKGSVVACKYLLGSKVLIKVLHKTPIEDICVLRKSYCFVFYTLAHDHPGVPGVFVCFWLSFIKSSRSVIFVQLSFAGFSIKAVPFQNAILNVKELGGKCTLLLMIFQLHHYCHQPAPMDTSVVISMHFNFWKVNFGNPAQAI